MTEKRSSADGESGNTQKDPDRWVTGDEPMTGAQRSYLQTLSEEAKLPFDDTLTKAEASRRIDELQAITGRGRPGGGVARKEGDESPLESIGEAISETVLGSEATPEPQKSGEHAGVPRRADEKPGEPTRKRGPR